jgi:DNA-binding LacI/PurR family transcriptional regulator
MLSDPLMSRLIHEAEWTVARIGWGELRLVLEPSDLPPDHMVAGYIALADWETFVSWRDRPHIPQVIIDVGGGGRATETPSNRLHRLGIDHQRAGAEVARHLAGLGHRHVAFISHLRPEEHPWLRKRIQGLSTVYSTSRLGRGRTMSVYQHRSSSPPANDIAGVRTAIRAALTKALDDPAWTRALPDTVIQKVFLRVADGMAADVRGAREMKPAFAAALRDPRPSAWVCANDQIAMAAHEFLRRSEIRVPGRISLVGFDNLPVSRILRLTTYDFRYQAMGAMAVQCLARPRAAHPKKRAILIEGTLIGRRSTGPPRG